MANKIIRFEPGGRHYSTEPRYAKKKKEEPIQPEPIRDEPDAAEHPVLQPEKPAPRVSRNLYRVVLILLAAALVLVALENWENLTPGNIGNWIRTKAVGFGFGDGYPVDIIGSKADPGSFGAVDGNMYVVSDTALTVRNGSAKELFSARHSYNNPAVSVAGDRYLIYNAGGSGYQICSASGTDLEEITENDITTGVLSSSGKYALALQPPDYASEFCVYMKDGTLQYQYKFADTYISAIALNSDGTRGAVASVIGRSGAIVSRITVFDFAKEEPICVYESEDNLIFGLMWSASNRIIAIGDTQTLVSDAQFNFDAYDYGGREVTAFTTTKNRAVVSVSNYAYGGSSTLLIFADRATPLEAELPGRAGWLSCAGSKVAAQLPDSVISVDLSTGALEGRCDVSADTKGIAMADEGNVYLLGVREIRKENLKVIRNPEELFLTD